MLRKFIKRSILNRFDDYVDTAIYANWLSRYEILKTSGRQPFMPDMPEKYFSQNDEDGYSLMITDRFDGDIQIFVEIGVGNGLENNTLILKANGMRGLWFDAEPLPSAIYLNPAKRNFRFVRDFATPHNITNLLQTHLQELETDHFDFLSIDIDGDDLSVLNSITNNFKPKVIVAEVNSKLGPDSQWRFSSNLMSTPAGDYFGMSFRSLKEALSDKGYNYLAMNAATGLNAFFIDETYRHLFPELKLPIGFVPPFYRWPRRMFGNPSFQLVTSILNE